VIIVDEKLEIGSIFHVHCYKHDGKVHKSWNEVVLICETDEFLICGNDNAKVIEADGRSWRTGEPAIIFYNKKNWYDVIAQLKKSGITYYCDIASPCVIDENVIKYIDYDLDVRVFVDGAFKIKDRGEYNYHKRVMSYSKGLDKVLKSELTNLIELIKNKKGPFEPGIIEKYYKQYNELKNSSK
jgi:protein associated with RNAse G/E